jgi:RNA ligase
MTDFIKYPRTPHLRGSKLQDGDHDLEQVDLADLKGGVLVWEEKVDGANAAFSFSASGAPQLQSRGHYLQGGAREEQFSLFKAWVDTHQDAFRRAIAARYIVFGEWCYAKHTVFYDQLPHYFLEFDVLDRETGRFLSTPARRRLLESLPIVAVPVVHKGAVPEAAPGKGKREAAGIRALIKPSLYKSQGWRGALDAAAAGSGQDPARVRRETDGSDLAEGLYLKHEDGDCVIGRYKFVRADFLQAIASSGTHWQDRPVIPNGLAPGVDLFAASVSPEKTSS